jgi:hypothetical protein
MSYELKMPFAKDISGQYILSQNAKPGNMYFCPLCHQILIFKSGKKNRQYFVHPGELKYSHETAIQFLAKKIIVHVIEQWKKGEIPAPLISRRCKLCGKEFFQPLPQKVTSSKEECHINSGHTVDVGLFCAYQIIAGVQIQAKHALDDNQKEKIDIPFIVLEGKKVLTDPFNWTPLIDHFNASLCLECQNRDKQTGVY